MISIKNLTIRFQDELVIDELSFEIKAGSKSCFTGPSGSGKSTLINSILGFVSPQKGEISVDGVLLNRHSIREIRSNTAYLPQALNLPLDTVKELIYYPFEFKRNKANKPKEKEVLELMKIFGLEENLIDKSLGEISGGQKQRFALISCVLQKKPLLILDEPTSALDNISVDRIISYLFEKKDLTLLSASHHDDWIKHCNFLVSMNSIPNKSN